MDRVMLLLMSMRLLDRADEPGRHLLGVGLGLGDTTSFTLTGPTSCHSLCKMQVTESRPCKAAWSPVREALDHCKQFKKAAPAVLPS